MVARPIDQRRQEQFVESGSAGHAIEEPVNSRKHETPLRQPSKEGVGATDVAEPQ